METIEDTLKEMNLHRVKKVERLSPQEYYKYITVQYKKRWATLPKITSPDMMNIFEVRDEFHDDTSTVVMKYCVNKNLDETQRYISEHDI